MGKIRIVNELIPGTDVRVNVAHIGLDFDGVIQLGLQHEGNVTAVAVDITPYLLQYGEGEFVVIHKRAGDDEPTERYFERNENELYWLIEQEDCENVGIGEMQIILLIDGNIPQIKKSKVFLTQVMYVPPYYIYPAPPPSDE